MRKRDLAILAALPLALLLVALGVLLCLALDPVSRRNAGRLHDGLSEREVEAILGRPADASEPIPRSDPESGVELPTGKTIRRWYGRGAEIVLLAHEDGTTTGATYFPEKQGSVLGWLRRKLGL